MKKIQLLLARLFLFTVFLQILGNSALAQNYTMTNLWTVNAGSVPYLSLSSSGERGMAFNPTTGHLLLISRESPNRIVVLNSTDGSSNSLMSITGVITSGTGIQFLLNYIGVAADGAIYATDLAIPAANTTNNFIVYRWANETANPTIAYQGPIGSPGLRYGDSFAVTGSGVNTMLASGANSGQGVVVFTTPDGINFNPFSMTNSTATSGDLQPGLDFYSGNNYFCKHSGGTGIHESTFNLGTVPPTSIETTTNLVNGNYGPLKVSVSSNWLVCLNTQSGTSDSGHYVSLFNISSTTGNLTYVTSNALPANAGSGNGNAVGSVAINGSNVYVLDTDNAIEAFAILPVVTLVAPTVTVTPSSSTEYVGNPGFSFTAVPTGSLPISYQWFITSNSVTSPIPSATNITYAFANATTNMMAVYSVSVSNGAGTNISAGATLTVQTPFTTGRMTNIWSLQPGSRFYLDNASYEQRGLAYDSTTGDLLVASRYPTNLIAVLNAATGADEWLMDVDPSVITTANVTYPLNVIGVGDDGVVYGVPLVVAGQNGFQLYVWNDDTPGSGPQTAYTGTDPGNGTFQRWGDSMAVTGAGGNTMILLGSANETNLISVLTSSDGGNTFGSTLLTVTDPNNASLVGFAGLGVAWGTNNTFWTKSTSYNLRQISYNLSAGTATVLANYSTPFQGSQGNGIGVDINNNLLSILSFDNPPSVRLYDIWFSVQNANVTPVMIDQQLFAVNNPNANYTAVAVFATPYLFGLDSNNGIEAYTVNTSPLVPYNMGNPVISGGASTVLTWQSQPGRAYQVQRTADVSTPWAADGALVVSSNYSTSFTDTTSPTGTNAFFKVNGH